MKRFLVVFLLLLVFVQPLTAAARQSDRDTRWREDVQYLWQNIQAIHPEPFRTTPQATFEQLVSDLDAQIPVLTDQQIVVHLFEIVAALEDGHTYFWFSENEYPFRYAPLMFYPFSDGIYLVQASANYADLVGARLVSIGGMDIDQVIERLLQLTPHDNHWSSLVTIPLLLSMTDILLGTGLIDQAEQSAYVLECADGQQIILNPTPVGLEAYRAAVPVPVRLPARSDLLSLSKIDLAYWWTTLDEDQTLYVQYNAVVSRDTESGESLAAFKQELDDALATLPVQRVIFDMRYNDGGDINTVTPLRRFFSDHDLFESSGSLIVLIGRNTFSAAVLFSIWLENSVQPVFMGEPTGGKPRMFENARQLMLPNSHLSLQIATRARRDTVTDTRQTISPQVPIGLSSAEYFSDIDPVLAAARTYRPQ